MVNTEARCRMSNKSTPDASGDQTKPWVWTKEIEIPDPLNVTTSSVPLRATKLESRTGSPIFDPFRSRRFRSR